MSENVKREAGRDLEKWGRQRADRVSLKMVRFRKAILCSQALGLSSGLHPLQPTKPWKLPPSFWGLIRRQALGTQWLFRLIQPTERQFKQGLASGLAQKESSSSRLTQKCIKIGLPDYPSRGLHSHQISQPTCQSPWPWTWSFNVKASILLAFYCSSHVRRSILCSPWPSPVPWRLWEAHSTWCPGERGIQCLMLNLCPT